MEYKLILDQQLIDEYADFYFKEHPRARKKPIQAPRHESINKWFIMQRPQMNDLKQRWKDFGVWWMNKENLNNLHLEKFEMIFTTFMPTKRRADPDNYVPKFILDSFTEAGFIADDSGDHLLSLTLKTDYDKDNPRTEIIVKEI